MSKIFLVIIMCIFGLGSCYSDELVSAEDTETIVSYEETESSDTSAGGMAVEEPVTEAVTENSQADEDDGKLIDAQLLVKYPDKHGWMEHCDCGDIPYLANAAYIDKSLEEGIFKVSTPEELASFNYYVNAVSEDGVNQRMQLMNDIDLSGYEWAPMGWSDGADTGMSFNGGIYGDGYTIRNLYIDCDEYSAGLIGQGKFCGVWNLTLENAYVKGRITVGVLTGDSIQGWYENCHVSGEVYGDKAGSLHGYSAGHDIYDCTADVLVNGESFPFLTWNEKERSEIVIENPLTVVLHDDYSVSYTPGQDFSNLGWQVKKDGRVVVERNSPYETYSYEDQSPGTYSICLTAFVEGQYVPVSNTVEYTIE
ncbi:MAG: hypothetical protein IJ397_06450 [Lachnospiraceae bacterium]|nr:hypothetical protein [Lachnospiraceae bacterium]